MVGAVDVVLVGSRHENCNQIRCDFLENVFDAQENIFDAQAF